MTIKKHTFTLEVRFTKTPDWEDILSSVERHIQDVFYQDIVSVEISDNLYEVCRDTICDDCDERRGEPMHNEGYD